MLIYFEVPCLDYCRYDTRGTYNKQVYVYCFRSKLCIIILVLFLFVLYRHATKFVVCCTTLPEIHADFFGRNASPLQVYVFVAVANRGEDVMSDEICRRFNRTHQQRTRSGRSVQVSDWFMIRHSSSGHVCTYTYVPRTTKYIRRR